MTDRSAVIFLPNDAERIGSDLPLMLHRVLDAPVLSWLSHALRRAGVSRFFLICPAALLAEARACFPAGVELAAVPDEGPGDRLHVFLSTAPEEERELLVVTGPTVYVPNCRRGGTDRANACLVDRRALMEALDETAPIGRFLQRAGEPVTCDDGFFPLSDTEALPRLSALLIRDRLLELLHSGVEIWDLNNTYVAPGVELGGGTALLPGTLLQGKTAVGRGCTLGPNTRIIDSEIGDGCVVEQSRVEGAKLAGALQVGPFANLRPGTVMEAGTKAGAFVELKNTNLGTGAQVAHLSYLGDAAIGAGANVGCGAVTANFDRVEKHFTVVEEGAFLGCNSTLVAPVNVGKGAYVAAGTVVTEDVPPNALAISRPRQQIKKEWALRNKRADS